MKTVIALALLAALNLTSRDTTKQQDVAAVKQAIEELTAFERNYDAKGVEKMLDDEFVYVGNDGELTTRADFLRLTDPKLNPLDIIEVTEIEVHVSGDAAVATAKIHEKGQIDGKTYEFRGRTLASYVKRQGRWLCLAMHD